MKEALKLALEALQLVSIEFVCNGAHHARKDRHDWLESCPVVERYQVAITAAREALAQPDYRAVKTYHEGKPVYVSQPEQEPVAWEQFYPDIGKPQLKQEPVYVSQPEQEPVACDCRLQADECNGVTATFHPLQVGASCSTHPCERVYTVPPKAQRPWVRLTDEFCITNMVDVGHCSLQIVFKSRKNADEFKAAHNIGVNT